MRNHYSFQDFVMLRYQSANAVEETDRHIVI